MKTTKPCIFSFLVLLFLTVTLPGQTLDLYLQPDLESEKLETVERDDSRLGAPAPVLDEISAAIGWQFAEFNGTINGFVPDAKIGKDLFPVENAIIYSRPSSESPVITTYQLGDELEIIDTGAWWEVRLTTTFPVYFLVEQTAEFTTAPPLLEDLPESGSLPTAGASSILPDNPLPAGPADVTGQSYQGIFRKSKKGLGLFAPKAPFYLQDPAGGRIAWIDTSGLIDPGTLQRYVDQPVILFGERDFDASKKEWIIHVRNMRVK